MIGASLSSNVLIKLRMYCDYNVGSRELLELAVAYESGVGRSDSEYRTAKKRSTFVDASTSDGIIESDDIGGSDDPELGRYGRYATIRYDTIRDAIWNE